MYIVIPTDGSIPEPPRGLQVSAAQFPIISIPPNVLVYSVLAHTSRGTGNNVIWAHIEERGDRRLGGLPLLLSQVYVALEPCHFQS
jgi:hypothetical protein